MRVICQRSTWVYSGQVEPIFTAPPAPPGSLFPTSRPCSPPKFSMAVWQRGDSSRDEHVQNLRAPLWVTLSQESSGGVSSTPTPAHPAPSGMALQPGWAHRALQPSCPSLEAELAMTQPPHPSPFPCARPVGKSLPCPPPPPPAYQIWPCLKRPGFLFTKKDQNWVIGCRHRCLCASLMCKQHCRALTQRRRPRHTQAPRGCHRPFWGSHNGVKLLGAGRGWLSSPENAGGQRPGAAVHLKHGQVVAGLLWQVLRTQPRLLLLGAPAPPAQQPRPSWPCLGCDHAGDTSRAQTPSPEHVVAKRAPRGCLVWRGPAADHSRHRQRSQRPGRRRVAESQTTLAPCPVCSEAPWHLGDRTHLRRGTARGWGFPFLAARFAGTGHTAGQQPAPLRGHGAGSKPGALCGLPGPSLPRLARRGCSSLGEQRHASPAGQSGTGRGEQPWPSGPCPRALHTHGQGVGLPGPLQGHE
ncbi:interleukin-17B isoform X1 [Corvus moneduloides]|uniref:interleukin-17B isoform X1 n=1 Tax=Corvus moneduloides TaxID=1196302 RepID=UPI001363F53C|nr:interleukin-17B isoform X1 [Corvus moneduloides]